jgi:hypothetical protein
MYIDLTAKGYYLQAYTKVLHELKLFGLCNGKINASLIPKVKVYYLANGDVDIEKTMENAGLDENGNYIWEDETFPYDIAMEIVVDPRYSANCGTIAVGISNKHILKLLADDRISMVIPYHKSGLNHEVAMMRDIALYNDYTKVQSTRFGYYKSLFGGNAGKKLDGVPDFDFYGDLYGVDGKEGTHDPKTTAQNYLNWCDRHNYIPKFDEFRDNPNYYKLLIDFRVYDVDGTYREQQPVKAIYPSNAEFKDLILNGVVDKNGKVYGGLKQQQQTSDKLSAETQQIVDEYRQRLTEKYGEDVLVQNSDRDSDGDALTKEQIEFFKNSKVRDANGNLLKVYHGSASKFTVFLHKFLNSHGNAHGRGFYFTEKKSLAEGYSKEGGQLLEGYLNIENPLSEEKVTIKKSDLAKLIKATCEEQARSMVEDEGYTNIKEALPDTWVSNYVNTYSMNINDVYKKVADIIYSGSDNDVEIIAELTNAGAGNENVLRLTRSILGYDGVIYENEEGYHEFVSLTSNQFKNVDNTNPTMSDDIRYSDRDSDGDALTKEQIEFFKDSKVRDDKGNLLVVYHGTDADFTVFKKRKGMRSFALGINYEVDSHGFFFTPDETYARKFGTRIKSYYIDVKKPLIKNNDKINLNNLDEKGRTAFYDEERIDELYYILEPVIKDVLEYEFEQSYSLYEDTEENIKLKKRWALKDLWMYFDGDIFSNMSLPWEVVDNKHFDESLSRMSELGYDGFMVCEGEDSPDSWFILQSRQAKLTTNTNPTSSDDIRYSDRDEDLSVFEEMGEAYRIEEETEWLKEDIKWLNERVKLEGQVTNGKYFKDSSIVAAAEVLLKKVESKYDKVQLARSLRDLYYFIRSAGSEADADVVMQKAHDIARQILSGAKPMVVKNDYYAKLLSEIKKTRVRFNKNQKAECSARIGKNWNRSFFGKIILADDARTELDQQWKEWAEEYPDIFDANIKDGDQPMELRDILASLKANSEIVEEYNNEENAMWLVKEILNQYWNLTPLVTTADKYSGQIKELNAKHRQKMKEARDDYNVRVEEAKLAERMFYGKKMLQMRKEYDAKLEKLRKSDADKLSEANQRHELELYEKELAERMHFGAEVAKLRRIRDERVAEAKEHGKQKMAEYKENVAKKTKIQSITSNVLDLNDKLVKNSKDKHIPEAMKDAVGELLRAIDFSSKRKLEGGEPTKKDIALEKALGHLKDAITDGSKEIGDILDEMYGSGIDDSIKELVKSVDKHMSSIDGQVFTLNEMTLDELNKLDSIVKIIKATANKVNKFHVAQHNAGVQALGVRSMEEIDSRKKIFKNDKKHFEKMKTSVFWNNLNPFYAFKNLGEASQKIFTALQDGQDKLAFLSKEVIDFADSVYSAKDYNKWKDTYFEFEVAQPNGKIAKFSMNVPQIMSLYCVTKQEDARTHILHGGEDGEGGGITIVETDKKEAVRTNIRLTEADLNNIISKLDGVNNVKGDKTAKGVADELQEFMCRRGADLGNEISMARWGIKSFGITNYFPIKVSEGSVPMKNDAPGVDSVSMLELLNMSFTHARNHFAKQSVEIGDVFDVFSSHMSNMARYNAMALPILDMYKWMNSRVKDEYGAEHSVQTSIKDTFGEYAWKYFGTLLKDISGGTKKSTRDKLAVRFFKNAKVAKVAANIRVVALQFTSYIRAGAVMDNKYLLKSLNYFSTRELKDENFKNSIAKAKKYCGIALWRSMGYYDTDITRGLTEKIKHSTDVRSKLVEWTLKGAEWADEKTWGMMWNACEFEIRDKHPELKPKTEEYYKAVGERLRDVIYRTQVVDSMLTRSQMMRSPDAWDKVLTMFGSESTLSLNLAMDVFTSYELDKRSLGKEKAKAKNKKYIRKAITAYIVTNVVTSALQTLFDAFRDYDEDEKDEEYLTKLMLENFLSNSSIINKIPYLNAFSSIISGFTPSRTDVDWMNDSVKAVKAIYKCFAEGKSVEPAIRYTLKTLSDASGIAGYNLYRDIYALYELIDGD